MGKLTKEEITKALNLVIDLYAKNQINIEDYLLLNKIIAVSKTTDKPIDNNKKNNLHIIPTITQFPPYIVKDDNINSQFNIFT